MLILAILFSLAALVWLIPLIQGGRITHFATIVLLCGTVLGPAYFAIDGPIQISLDRMLWGVLIALAAIRWRMGELSFGKLTRIDWTLIGLACWLLVSALRGGPVPGGGSPIARWLFYIAVPVGMFAVCRMVPIRIGDVRWFTRAILVLGLYLAVTALFEITNLHALVFPKYIVSNESWEFLGRGRGPLLNPAGNGILITIAFVIAILGFLESSRRGKVVYGILTAILACGVYATLTRSVWLGAAAAGAMIAMVYAPRWVRVLGVCCVLLLGGAMATGLKDQLLQLKRDKHLSAADAEKSIQLRPLLAIVCWEMFKDRPIIGHGFGHYFEHSGPYHGVTGYDLPLQDAKPYGQHNVFLSVLADAGLVGLFLVGFLVISLSSVGWRLARSRAGPSESRWLGQVLLGAMAAYVCNGMFHDVLIIPMVHMYVFFIGGLAVTAFQRGLAASEPEFQSYREPATLARA